ncbi:MAG: MBL fold metallo-hydrolase [Undibacterium sp.]|nr:MBL fold metallo-hydrolase [Opitutaceae bacterium]
MLVSHGAAVLIDTGLMGAMRELKIVMGKLNLAPTALKAILLTHGHLDHTLGLAEIRTWSGAQLYAHPAEQIHIGGCFPYRGPARVCGWLENAGRMLFNYKKSIRPTVGG